VVLVALIFVGVPTWRRRGGHQAEPAQPPLPEETLRASGAARALVGGAAVTAVLAALWLWRNSGLGLPFWLFFAVLTAGPLLFREHTFFRRAALRFGLALVALGVLGSLFGLFYYLPGAVVLLLAAAAEREASRPRRGFLAAGVAVLLVGAVGWGIALQQAFLVAPDAFLVSFVSTDAQAAAEQRGYHIQGGPDFLPGATGVSISGDGWYVSFDEDEPDEEQARLRQRLQQIPGVGEVRLCSRRRGEC
jgi:hypothetical protein